MKISNNLRYKRDTENLMILFYRQFFMLHPKKSIAQVKIQKLRGNCRHVLALKPFLRWKSKKNSKTEATKAKSGTNAGAPKRHMPMFLVPHAYGHIFVAMGPHCILRPHTALYRHCERRQKCIHRRLCRQVGLQQGPPKCLGPCLERCTAAGLLLWRGGRIAIRGPTNLQKPPKLRNGNYQGVQAAK